MQDPVAITIAGRRVGPGHPPYVIAELSANHNGKLEHALQLIERAKGAGADAVKIQTYRPDTITLKCDSQDFRIDKGLWAGRTLYELYEWAHTPWEWHADLFQHAVDVGITLFSSPFDNTAVDLLEDLGSPAYKIASFEIVDLALIRYVASTGKPMIMSTGMASREQIEEAVDAAKQGGCGDLALLHCVSGYPAPPEDYNLATIPDMIRHFNLVTGLSDHTLESATAVAGVALGAAIIEKHFTLDRRGGGPDDSFSLEPGDLSALCRDVHTAWSALGRVNYEIKSSEAENVKFQRSLYFIRDMREGDVITAECVRSVRPGYGLAPKFLDLILGQRLLAPVKANTPVTSDVLAL